MEIQDNQVKAICHDDGRIEVWLDDEIYDWYQKRAYLSGLTVEEFLKQVIMDGIKKHM